MRSRQPRRSAPLGLSTSRVKTATVRLSGVPRALAAFTSRLQAVSASASRASFSISASVITDHSPSLHKIKRSCCCSGVVIQSIEGISVPPDTAAQGRPIRMSPRAIGRDQTHPHALADDRMVARKLLDLVTAHQIQAAIAAMNSIKHALAEANGEGGRGRRHPTQFGHRQSAVVNLDIGLLQRAMKPFRGSPAGVLERNASSVISTAIALAISPPS